MATLTRSINLAPASTFVATRRPTGLWGRPPVLQQPGGRHGPNGPDRRGLPSRRSTSASPSSATSSPARDPSRTPWSFRVAHNEHDVNVVYGALPGVVGPGLPGQSPYVLPNGVADWQDTILIPTRSWLERLTPSVPGAGRGRVGARRSLCEPPRWHPCTASRQPVAVRQLHQPDPRGLLVRHPDLSTPSICPTTAPPHTRGTRPDDNYNAFDPFPLWRPAGELGDLTCSTRRPAGNLLPSKRTRRYVNACRHNGTGGSFSWPANAVMGARPRSERGADNFAASVLQLFRPAGVPGMVSSNYNYDGTTSRRRLPPDCECAGAIVFPRAPPAPILLLQRPPCIQSAEPVNGVPIATVYPNYLADQTNNPFHGFESFKLPNLFRIRGQRLRFPRGPILAPLRPRHTARRMIQEHRRYADRCETR